MQDEISIAGAVDAGSNALRAVVAEVSYGAVLRRLGSVRVPVRLGHGAFTVGELDLATADDAVAAFRRFRALFDAHGVQRYRAVATSALRTVRNRDVVVHRLHAEAGIEVEIITGREEARLVRRAVEHALGPDEEIGSLLDLGGGSLEVGVREGDRWRSTSLAVGTVRLLETLGLNGSIRDDEAAMVRRYAGTMVRTFGPDRVDDRLPAAACGGNAECYARLLDGPRGRVVDIAALDTLLADVLPLDVEGRMEAFGVRRDRAEVMGIAGLVLSAAARELGASRLIVPHVGLRDALLLELAEADPEDAVAARARARLISARTFAAKLGHDIAHGEHVRKLVRSLFRQLMDLHKLPAECEGSLCVAAVLHDVGEVVHRRRHASHGAYLVRNGHLLGLNDVEREMVAVLVRLHRHTDPRKSQSYRSMSHEQRAQIRRMLALLRLADALDTHRRQSVRDVRCVLAGRALRVELVVETAPEDLVELALRKRSLIESELGVSLSVAVVVQGTREAV